MTLLDKPLTAEEILEEYAANKDSWSGWENHHIDFEVGYATAELHSVYSAFRTVYSVHVHVDHRGQGHGRRLMEVITAYADAVGVGLNLSVYADNEAAIRLYTSVGFRIRHTREAGIDEFGRPNEAIHYMERYPTRIPSTPEWDAHFEAKALRLERDHEPRLGGDLWVEFFADLYRAQMSRDHTDDRARYTGSANYEENSRRLSCDATGAALRALGWTITRTPKEN